jgi:hypothetical protein
MGKRQDPDPMNNPIHISESFETIFLGLKYLTPLMRIREGKNSDPGGKNSELGCLLRIRNTGFYIIFLSATGPMLYKNFYFDPHRKTTLRQLR